MTGISSSNKQATVIFLPVFDNTSKMSTICSVVQQHFEQKRPIQIAVASDEAAQYLDLLLWRMPEESFLPHVISSVPVEDLIVITKTLTNLNCAEILFNLCPEVSAISSQFAKIYELLDHTHPDKLRQSQLRQETYQALGCEVQVFRRS